MSTRKGLDMSKSKNSGITFMLVFSAALSAMNG